MDKKFINENKFTEDVKRFNEVANYRSPRQSLKEYTFYQKGTLNDGLNEDDNTPQPQGPGIQQQPQNGSQGGPQGGPQQPPMGGEQQPIGGPGPQGQSPADNMGGAHGPQDQGPADNMGGEGGPMGPDSGMGQDGPDMGVEGGPMSPDGGDMPADNMGNTPEDEEEPPVDDEDNVETTEMEPDDELVDVDELTQAQEETDEKVDGVDARISKLYKAVKEFANLFNDTNKKIEDIKGEIERRNPTQVEKMNIRSQAGVPFNVNPQDYWEKKAETNPNYEIMQNNDVNPADEQKEFEIRKGDIDGLNMKTISDTLNYNPKLEDFISF